MAMHPQKEPSTSRSRIRSLFVAPLSRKEAGTLNLHFRGVVAEDAVVVLHKEALETVYVQVNCWDHVKC